MKTLIATLLVLAAAVYAAEEDKGAPAELRKARAALDEGHLNEVFQHAAKVQTLFYRNTEALAEALYYEAAADSATGGSRAKVSALTELKTLYPDSRWCRKAIDEFETDGTE